MVRYAIFNLDVLTANSFDEQRTGDIMALQRQISQVVKFPLSVAFIVLKKGLQRTGKFVRETRRKLGHRYNSMISRRSVGRGVLPSLQNPYVTSP